MIDLNRPAGGASWLRWVRALMTPAAAARPAEAAVGDRLSALRATLTDPGATFSAAWMLQQLHELEPGLARAPAAIRCQWHASLQLLHLKRGDWDALVEHGEAALALEGNPGCLSARERADAFHMLHTAYAELGDTERAIAALRRAIDAAPAAWLSRPQRLGVQQRLGYLLHSALREVPPLTRRLRRHPFPACGERDPATLDRAAGFLLPARGEKVGAQHPDGGRR